MEKSYLENSKTYETKYDDGYGLQFPDGHVIRFYQRVLKHEFNINKGKILDYGCGTGTHLKFFQKCGFTPYGVDIVPKAIAQTKLLLPEFKENFHTIPFIPNLKDYFSETFDIIFTNQVLYYFNDKDIQKLCDQFLDLLKPGGIFFATMMAPTCGYHKFIESTNGDLRKVVLKGRLNETSYINFKTREGVLEIFKNFKKIHLGFYGMTIIEEEGASDHYIFIGTK